MNASDRSESSISPTLLLRIKANDSDAWRRLVRTYGPLVYRWCVRAGLREDDAADVGQEVFRAVAEGIDQFRRERAGDTFVGWLRTITRYKIADHHRRQAVRPDAIGGTDFQIVLSQLPDSLDEEDDGEPRSSQQINAMLYHRALQIIRNEFEDSSWKAFWGTAVDGRPTRDVAADLRMTPVAVRKAKSRVLRRLRDEFDDELLG